LRHVQPAVLAALVAGSFLGPHGTAVDATHVGALAVAVAVATRRGTIAVLAAGMATLWVWLAIV
jgi:branched-subunit amino acid transport protein